MAQTAGVINGGDFFMFDNRTLIAHTTKHTLNFSLGTFDVSDKDSSAWTYRKAGRRDWSVSGDGLYTFDSAYGFSQLFALITNRTKVNVKLATAEATNKYYQGYGYLASLTLDTPSEEGSTYSFTFEGDGPLLEGTGT